MNNKKSISELIAVILLILVAVVAVVSFETFFNSYQSTLQTKLESHSENINSINLDLLQSGMLYVTNKNNFNLTLTNIKVNDKVCNVITNTITPGTNTINISSCLINITKKSIVDVVLITKEKIYEAKLIDK